MGLGKLFFCIALLGTCLSIHFPSLPLLTFAPYLVYHLTHSTFKSLLWKAIGVGLFIDCFTSFLPFGFHMSAYTLCCIVLYRKRALLIGDKPLSLPLYTLGFSLIFSILQYLYLTWTKTPISLDYSSLSTEFLLMPLQDSLYALTCFTLPSWLLSKYKELRLKA